MMSVYEPRCPIQAFHPQGEQRVPAFLDFDLARNGTLARVSEESGLAARIEIREDETSSRIWDSRYLADVFNTAEIGARGKTFHRSVTMRNAIGGPGNPIPKEMLDDKFLHQVRPVIGDQRADRLVEALWSVESVRSANELAALY